ncbi:MAG: hypothetical protein EA374_02320 [Acholeplasmatales bacterium]|nr:MAG: hypothetical protein EA374_02320 [Acholeplasmatales bacterium]
MAEKKDPQLKTLILSVFFSAFGPLVSGWAVTLNTASTQLADFTRRSLEFGVLIFALYVYVRVRHQAMSPQRRQRLERRIAKLAACVLFAGAFFLLMLFIRGIQQPSTPEGSVIPGVSIAVLGALFNGTFFFRYRRFHQTSGDVVMGTQSKLYQAKTVVDVHVIVALTSVLVFGASHVTLWIDRVGTVGIAMYLLVRGVMMFKQPIVTI